MIFSPTVDYINMQIENLLYPNENSTGNHHAREPIAHETQIMTTFCTLSPRRYTGSFLFRHSGVYKTRYENKI